MKKRRIKIGDSYIEFTIGVSNVRFYMPGDKTVVVPSHKVKDQTAYRTDGVMIQPSDIRRYVEENLSTI